MKIFFGKPVYNLENQFLFSNILDTINGLFQKFLVTPLLRITIFRIHTPLEFQIIFSRTPLEFHGNPLSSIMTPPPGIFQIFIFKTPLEFPLSSTGGIRKISGKALKALFIRILNTNLDLNWEAQPSHHKT